MVRATGSSHTVNRQCMDNVNFVKRATANKKAMSESRGPGLASVSWRADATYFLSPRNLPSRDVHGNPIPIPNENPMGIPWEWESLAKMGMGIGGNGNQPPWEWE